MAEFIFWMCLLLPVYAYLGYPLLLTVLAPLFPAWRHSPAPPLNISIVIAAHNEARHIEHKLRTLLAQDYQPATLQIILASDGSTDDTVARAHKVVDSRITVLDLPRQGKAATLNAGVALATGDILVFTDADNQWSRETLGYLLAPLSDPNVGACAGHMVIPVTGGGLSVGDSLYRHYEGWLRRVENRTGCMVSADGALLALRRELFQSVPAEVNDDFFLSTCAPVAFKRIVYVPEAQVIDHGVDEADKQFRRRQRVTVGGLQSLAQRRELLNPLKHGLYSLALISHKLIRRLAPILLLPLLLSNFWLWDDHGFYRLALIAQLFGYAIALAGLLDSQHRLPKPFRLAAFLLVTLAGMSLGLWQFLRGHRYAQWNPEQNR
ncbi:Glycosyltransferase, catalytic subunit of cellulose synthase and poly-beta-1,6-N-acetylglucosamine synthase [Pseudomonas sp. LAMO17WK12:I6]|uniref:glycosyltransferase family 2 protein n=1 Tax=unclassified Pseudomonas TaxID=196821 RepID=UPI000BD9DFD2|nr:MULTISPECIES: glycosyltransferase family 2 protein [unclassified Pseudomonas]SNY16385.1 Glycosyltransferase, catalytic subunit of cellulose synthase and poly-beta-1,6-N-acetylglucosamine synthase [Pseudomonas sp. LAMO17WK12:I5]SNY30325.1 Glycosyltransferase, catalytic subunit of cellulose synthase and poly-beta-1,6-N-acetylglucosamine synthase [Pseudomonas sp. LAMO17WK12:I6]